jgi:hypothetical protein
MFLKQAGSREGLEKGGDRRRKAPPFMAKAERAERPGGLAERVNRVENCYSRFDIYAARPLGAHYSLSCIRIFI